MKKVIIPAALLALLFTTSCKKTVNAEEVEEIQTETDTTAVVTENLETNTDIVVEELQ